VVYRFRTTRRRRRCISILDRLHEQAVAGWEGHAQSHRRHRWRQAVDEEGAIERIGELGQTASAARWVDVGSRRRRHISHWTCRNCSRGDTDFPREKWGGRGRRHSSPWQTGDRVRRRERGERKGWREGIGKAARDERVLSLRRSALYILASLYLRRNYASIFRSTQSL
jgi:hypothetical protein